jgi:hypothetical protein
MATIKMRAVREGEIPFAAGTAVQDDPGRPAFTGNGPNDYVCVSCGNLLAHNMHPLQMNVKVRVRCGGCDTINVALQPDDDEAEGAEAPGASAGSGS